ncbi:hypothetical protein ABMA27_012977 [Loxostege sticticalis]|uniref:FP protein C-terminal domain-containing protein n=1 Tax=Loxostege sticticalis TaxID=481309 RepID=A0ABR3IDL1_LOXSC
MPKIPRSPPAAALNKSQSASESDIARATSMAFEDVNVTQRDSKRRRLSDTEKESEREDFRNIIREELHVMLQSLQSQQNTRLDALEKHFTEIKAQECEIKKINPTLLELKNTNANIDSTISFLASQNEDLKKRLEQMEAESRKDKEHIGVLEQRIEDLQREGRKANLEIKNVPKLTDETRQTLIGMVTKLSETVGYKLNEGHITDIYRVKGKKGATADTPIVVETSSAIIKTELLTRCKAYNRRTKEKLCAKHLGLKKNEDTPIFVSEQLTAKAARLFFLARELVKNNTYKYCWTAYGRIYLRENDTSPVITVRAEAQISSLMLKT